MEDGSREWQPVQEIVRLTFKSFNEIIRAQGEAIQNLERAMEGKTNKSESTTALAEKVNVTELTHTFEDLSRIIDSKTDAQENAVALERKAGRILANGWPTGVEVAHAMVHGGPFPSTSDARTTSVGSLAIDRYLRPVSYQNLSAALLPQDLKDEAAGTLPRLVDGQPG